MLKHGLTFQETKDLCIQAGIVGIRLLDHEELKVQGETALGFYNQQKIWNATCCIKQKEKAFVESPAEFEECAKEEADEAIGFAVKNTVLFPCEAERGFWLEHYSLIDHAQLTIVFSPVRIQCSNEVS